LFLALFVFIVSSHAQNTIHVPADQPTIQAGIDAANNGDTVLVAPGTYNENIDFKGKAITVTSGATAFSGAASTIISGAAIGPVVVFQSNEPSTSVLNGFTVQNGHGSGTFGPNGGGISIAQASPTITNNIVTNNTGCGVLVFNLASPLIQGNDIKQNKPDAFNTCATPTSEASPGTGLAINGAGNVQVIGNTIEENFGTQSLPASGVVIQNSSQVLLKNNIIRNNQGGLGMDGQSSTVSMNLLLIQNLIYGNIGEGGILDPVEVGLGGNIRPPYPTVTEINNTIYGGGQEFTLTFAPSIVENNIFVNTNPTPSSPGNNGAYSGLWCADPEAQSSPITFTHNDIFNVGTLLPNTCTVGASTLAVDPQFLNPAALDFHTQPTSPVVAEGDIDAPNIPPADFDSKARTVCGTIDMGVYEIRPHPPITLQSSANPIVGGNSVTFTATVQGNCNVPTGTVTFLDGTTVLGTVVLDANASASLVAPSLFVGSHNITVTYPGDFNFENSTSNTVVEVVTGYPTAVSMTAAPNPADAFQAITLNATVASAFGTPTGTVTFMAGGSAIGTATLNSSGTALATVSTLGAGTYNITAVYSGSTDYAAGTSAPVVVKVVGANTTTSLSASPNPVIFAQTVTLTATVAATQGSGVPGGPVTFLDGTQTLGTANLNAAGMASFSTSSLALGTHGIIASYAGSPNANASISTPLNVVVAPIPTSLGLNATPNPGNLGQAITFTARAAGAGGVTGGTVSFSDQGTLLGTAAVNSSGVATFTTSSLSAGTHEVTATLGAFGNYGGSTSTSLAETILNYDFSLSASTTSLTIPPNDFQVITVTVTPSGGFPRALNLTCSQAPLYAECIFSQPTTKPLSSGPQTVKLTVSTSSLFGYGNQIGSLTPQRQIRKTGSVVLSCLLLPALLLCGLAGKAPRRLSGHRRLLLLLALAAFGIGLQGCSGRLPLGTPPGNYVLTVTATDSAGTLAHSINLNLQVPQ
jgi:parallel beta-helix repeat protein